MKQSESNLLYALTKQASDRGFVRPLFLDEDGDFLTYQEEIVEPLIIEIIQCPLCSATIYLVVGENVRGIWVHHWCHNY